MTSPRSLRTAPTVAVIGAGRATASEREWARAIGRGLAEGGATIVCGGLGGVMAAACAGAHEVGGTTIGILPGVDRSEANDDVDVVVPTGLGEGRNLLVVRSAQAVVAVGGAYGTLSEIALALRAGLPVVGLHTWALLRDEERDPGVLAVSNPGEAVRRALGAVRRAAA